MSKSAFIEDARSLRVREELAALLYETLVNSFRVEKPTMEDDLYGAFGMVGDELDELVVNVAEMARLRLPSPAETLHQSEVRTVKDVLLFLNGFESRSDLT